LRRQIESGIERGAQEIVIDTARLAPVCEDSVQNAVWIELAMPDGKIEKGEPLGTPLDVLDYFGMLREETLLDKRQEGDALTGTLVLQAASVDAGETTFPISYRPHRDGEEVRIDISARK